MAKKKQIERPGPGTFVELKEGDWWQALQALTGFDLEANLGDAAEMLTNEERAVVVIGGDVTLAGSVASAELANHLPDFDASQARESAMVVVLGDVTVAGDLHIVQDAQLWVTGTLRARTLRSCSANLVVQGPIEVEELICFEQSDEGGVLYGKSVAAPLTVTLDSGVDCDVTILGAWATDVIDDQKAALTRTASIMTRAIAAPYSLALYGQISSLIIGGQAAAFVGNYQALLANGALQISAPRAPAGVALPFWNGDSHEAHATFCGITVAGNQLYFAGGLGANIAFVADSAAGGHEFKKLTVNHGHGLRKFWVEGDTLWVCGQFGLVARSTNGGATFSKVETGSTSCMNTILRSGEWLWACGDAGAFCSRDGETWTKVAVAGEITRPQDSPRGMLLPSDQGYLYIANGNTPSKTALDAGTAVWAACATAKGTLLAVGNGGGIYRSTDGGQQFTKVASGVTTSLENIACTSGGLLVVVGEAGVILRSTDDGCSFQRVAQQATTGWLFGAAAYGDQVLVAGAQQTILTVG